MAAPNVDLFDSYFRKADLDRDGRISGDEAVGFLQGSGLPRPILAQIWMHADRNKIGFLGRAEFYNALKLVTVAQSKRELTPDIVKAAINGAASAKIPAPQINLAPVSAAPSNTGSGSPAIPMSTRPQVFPNSNFNPQYPPPQQNQVMRPPQALAGFHSRPTQGAVVQGFPGGGNSMSGPSFPNPGGAITGITPQVSNRGPSPSSSQHGFGNIAPGSVTSRPSHPPVNVSGNGFGTDSFFGGDIFSAAPSQPKQDSSAPAFSTGSLPVPSAVLPVSAGDQPSVRPNPLDYLRSSSVAQPVGGQLQPTQSFMTPNQEILTPNTTSTYSSSGMPTEPEKNASPWQKITKSDVQKYTKVFMEVDKDRDGKITGLEARNLFLSWRLPREVLKQVWDLSDQDNDSMLSLKEFCIALYLMERYREGRPLPVVLPSSIMFDFPTIGQSTIGYSNAPDARTSAWQQQQPATGLGAQQVRPAGGARPPRPVAAPQIDEEMQTKKPKSKVPILEKHLVDQLSKEEQETLNSKFTEASEADKKVEELEKEILESKEKIEFYRSKMQELVLYKSRCDNRLNEIIERISGDKHEVEILSKKYEAKCKQVGDVASKLTIEEATFRDIQERKMELYQAIVKMEEGGTADAILQVRADRVQSDLDELLKSLNDRCKKYGLRVKPTALVELPFGWQSGIQEEAADWDEDWDKFEDEGFTFVKELTLDVQNVIAPPKPKSIKIQKIKPSTVESPTADSPNASMSEKLPSIDENIHENGSPSNKNEDYSVRSAPDSPVAKASVESPSKEFSVSKFSVTGGADDSSPRAKESQSDYGATNSLHYEDKGYDKPTWGTFETNDDIDSVWRFNPSNTTTDADQERHTNDFFFGSGELDLNPIRTESSQENGFNQTRSSFFDDSVPTTPLYTSGYSPRQPDLSFNSFSRFDSFSSSTQDSGVFQNPQTFSRFDSMRSNSEFDQGRETLSRFDSMRSTTDFDLGRETLTRFDSMRSTTDFDHGQRFQSFDDTDPFGSSGPFNTSLEDKTPRRGSDNWRAF